MSRILLEEQCLQCDKTFLRRKTLPPNQGRFCSLSCSRIWLNASQKETRICVICSKQFQIRHSYQKATCSDECKRKNYSLTRLSSKRLLSISRQTGKRNKGRISKKRKPLVEKMCKQCDNIFYTPNKRATQSKFCSTDCWYTFLRENPTLHPTWRGGFFPYYGPNWKQEADAARQRDNYTCQECGRYRERPKLDVHHIVPLRLFNYDYSKANKIENLITLCKRCHGAQPK